MSRARALAAALAAAALDAGAVAAWWRVREARRAVVALLDPASPDVRDLYRAFGFFEAEATTLAAVGCALLFVAFAALAGLVGRRRGGGLRPRATAAVVAPVVIAGIAGLGLFLGARAFFGYVDPCADPSVVERYRYDAFAAHAAPYGYARLAILVTAAIGTAAVLRRARRAPEGGAPRLAAPLGLFALGLAAFAFTRAEAHDAGSPPPLLPKEGRLWVPASQIAAMPPALGCDRDGLDAPMVALEPRGWLLDGVPAADGAEITRVLAAKRELWRVVQPSKAFPGVLQAAIPAATPIEATRPLFEAARAAGYPIIEVLEALPAASWPTWTLGEVAYAPRACRLRIPDAQALPTARTWGELSRALAR
jgi:hypothetical protein